jgi:ATP phosphoribosyltransferase regulatory subunit
MLTQLVDLNGDKSTLTRAREELAAAPSNVLDAIDNLVEVAAIIESSLPGVKLNFDFAELRGYHYHTGLVFCAYLAGHGTAVAWGGRYDDIGKDFGRARPATGFSIDLNALIQLQPQTAPGLSAIGVPFAPEDNVLQAKIRELRQQGERVIQILPNQTGSMKDMGCTRQLVKQDDDWQLVSIN